MQIRSISRFARQRFARRAIAAAGHSAAPRVVAEPLEVRRLYSTVTWTGAGNDHIWGNGLNWSTGIEPQQNDDVVIPAGDPTVIRARPTVPTTFHSMTSGERLQIAGFMSVTGPAAFNAGLDVQGVLLLQSASTASDISISSATLGGPGQLTVAGAATWTGGSIAVSEITFTSGLTASGNTLSLAGGMLNLPAGSVSSLSGIVTMTNGSTVSNAGTFALNGAAFTTGGTGANTEVFVNTGTMNTTGTVSPGNTIGNRTAGTDPLMLRNSGTVNDLAGGFTVVGPDDGNTTGAFNVAAGAKLEFDSSMAFRSAASIIGSGSVLFGGSSSIEGSIQVGATSVNGSLTLLDSAGSSSLGNVDVRGTVLSDRTSNLNLSSLILTGGSFTAAGQIVITGALNWQSGSLTASNTLANGGMTVGASGTLNGGQLTNASGQVATFTNTLFTIAGAGRILNAGTLNLVSANLISNSIGCYVQNSGIINAQSVQSFPTCFNAGIVNVLSGTLTPGQGSASTGGQYNISAGAIFVLQGNSTFSQTSGIYGSGTVQFQGGVCDVNGAYNITGATAFISGSVTFTSDVTSFGAIANDRLQGTVNFFGNTPAIDPNLLIAGQINFGANSYTLGTFNLVSGAIQGSGVVTVLGAFNWAAGSITGLTVLANGGIGFNANGACFLNNATLVNAAGQTANFGANGAPGLTLTGVAKFQNDGTLNISRGSIDGPTTFFPAASFVNHGVVQVTAPFYNAVIGANIIFENDGTLDVQNSTLTIGATDFDSSPGIFNVRAGAQITFSSALGYQFSSAALISGAGNITFQGGGNYLMNGTYSATGPLRLQNASLTLNRNRPIVGTLTLSNSYLHGTSTITAEELTTLDSSTVDINKLVAAGGTLFTGTSPNNVVFDNTTYINPAGQTATIDPAVTFLISTNHAATLLNEGTLVASKLQIINGPNSPSTLINTGEIDVVAATTGASSLSLVTGLIFTNAGVVHVKSGSFSVTGTSETLATGSFVADSGTSIAFGGSTHTLDAGALISGTGSVSVTSELDLNGAQSINGPSLSISGGGIVRAMTSGATNSISGLTISNGTLDLNQSTLLITYAGPAADPLTTIRGYLKNGYNGGHWTGVPSGTSGVVTSAAAAASANQSTAIGYADSAEGLVTLPANTIELKYTLYGDTGLSGWVGFTDFMRMTQHYTLTNETWSKGDFNYDGTVDASDFNLLQPNYGVTLPAPAAIPAAAAPFASAPVDDAPPHPVVTPAGPANPLKNKKRALKHPAKRHG